MKLLTPTELRDGYVAHGPAWLMKHGINATEEAGRLRERIEELEELEREGERIRLETLNSFMDEPLDEPDDVDKLHERIRVLEKAGASAFNAWRTSSDVIGAMHVLREVVGAEFVDGQRKARNT